MPGTMIDNQAKQLFKNAHEMIELSRVQKESGTLNYLEFNQKALQLIETIETFLAKNYGVNLEPDNKTWLQAQLYFLHSHRAIYTFMYHGNKDELKQALRDIEACSTCPDEVLTFAGYDSRELRESNRNLKSDIEKEISKCFIATAAYNNPLAPEVKILRQFRDTKLKNSHIGQWMIILYERFSPPLADLINAYPSSRKWVRMLLSPIVQIVRHRVKMVK